MARSSWEKLAVGAVAGCLATVPMTLVMAACHRQLPWWQRYSLPPKQIIGDITDAVGVDHRLDGDTKNATTAVAHFAYGACMGLPYSWIEKSLPKMPLATGVGYGLLVWLANYLVGLPAANFSAAATREPLRRNAMMIVAHVVWGGALSLIYDSASGAQRVSETLRIRPADDRTQARAQQGSRHCVC